MQNFKILYQPLDWYVSS